MRITFASTFRPQIRAYVWNVGLLYVLWGIASLGWCIWSATTSPSGPFAQQETADPLTAILWWIVGAFAFVFLYVGPIVVAVLGFAAAVLGRVVRDYRIAICIPAVALAAAVLAVVPRVDVASWLAFALMPAIAFGTISRPMSTPGTSPIGPAAVG